MKQSKVIPGYENYSITTCGAVINNTTGKELKQTDLKGHKRIKIPNAEYIRKNFLVHRLVAEAFIDNPDSLPLVDHIDRKKDNNCVTNLRWADSQMNADNKVSHRKALYHSPYIGVNWNQLNGLWSAEIRVRGELIMLGSYPTEIAAATAYNGASILHGLKHLNIFAINDESPNLM